VHIPKQDQQQGAQQDILQDRAKYGRDVIIEQEIIEAFFVAKEHYMIHIFKSSCKH
jgi:hypothetical protein